MLTLTMKRKNISLILPWMAFITLLCILPVAFLYEKGGRVLFYYCAYFSLVGLVVEFFKRKAVNLKDRKALAMLLLGLVYSGWSAYFQYQLHALDGLYYTVGKRFILSFIIVTYLLHVYHEGYINKKMVMRGALLSLSLAFITASCFGILQSFTSNQRILLGINRATMTAYAYSTVILALIAVILRLPESRLKKVSFIIVSIVSLYVIMLTQTRSAMAIHTLFLIYMTFRFFAVTRNLKFAVGMIVLMLVAVSLSYKMIEVRVEKTVKEYTAYQHGNDKTSLGSRFTMWKTGILAFEESPLGQTQNQRNTFITHYLNEHHQSKSWALYYMNVHLHNEFIQLASIFGVVGVLVLLYFFYVFIVLEIIRRRELTPLAITSVAMLIYGMTDVLLTSVEFIAMFSVLVVLLSMLESDKAKGDALE